MDCKNIGKKVGKILLERILMKGVYDVGHYVFLPLIFAGVAMISSESPELVDGIMEIITPTSDNDKIV